MCILQHDKRGRRKSFWSLPRFFFLILGLCTTGLSSAHLEQINGGIRVLGDDGHGRLGSSVFGGDFNGDGTDDLIIGAPGRYGFDEGGAVYVIYGRGEFTGTIDLNYSSADLVLLGSDDHDGLGSAVSSGDINGDGISDLIIGAPSASPAGRASAGVTYVISGGDDLPNTLDLSLSPARLTVYGDDDGDNLGSSVSSGDVNGDGIDDLITGAPFANSDGVVSAGVTYVIYGGRDFPDTIDLSSASADITIYGDGANDWSGYFLSSGDVNGDGVDDVIIGAHKANPAGRVDAGEIYVIYGGPGLPSTVHLSEADLIVSGDDIRDQSGYSLSSGDINGDGIGDLIIGARLASPSGVSNAGETYVIYGGPSLPSTVDLSSMSADLIIYGDDADDQTGFSVSSGDVNGDGVDDVIIGAPGLFPSALGKMGKVYVVYGGTDLPDAVDLGSADLIVHGDGENDGIGGSVSSADINGDGVDDLIIGAGGAFPTGEVYVIYGGRISGEVDLGSEEMFPRGFILEQNYPNPFNAETEIRFGIPTSETSVELRIYDILGREVLTLVDAKLASGYHTVKWDGRNGASEQVASGVYLCVLKAADFTQGRKVVLMK